MSDAGNHQEQQQQQAANSDWYSSSSSIEQQQQQHPGRSRSSSSSSSSGVSSDLVVDDKPPAKIKLSFKLGSLKLQQQPDDTTTVSQQQALERIDIENDDLDSVDIEDDRQIQQQPTPAAVPAGHTPRIKLKFSLKKEAKSHDAVDDTTSAAPPMDLADNMDEDGHAFEHFSDNTAPVSSPPPPVIPQKRGRGRPPKRGKRSTSLQSSRGALDSSVSYYGTPPPLPSAAAGGGNSPATTVSLQSSLERLIKRIRKRDTYGFFMEPVDTTVITDYLEIIKSPMDLGTMLTKVETETYTSIHEFRRDLLQMCANARKYNGDGSIYARSADRIQEYALTAIDREVIKLERVGKASISPHAYHNEGGYYSNPFGGNRRLSFTNGSRSRSRSRSRSMSPGRDSIGDDFGDMYLAGIGTDYSSRRSRRSTRLRNRGTPETTPQTPMLPLDEITPSSIAESFKWSEMTAGGKRRVAKRTSTVPRRINYETQAKMPLLPDGSMDSLGYEEDMALVTFDPNSVSAPLVASFSRPPGVNKTYAYGRYYSSASFADYVPYRGVYEQHPINNTDLERLGSKLHSIHGNSMGLAYWRSLGEFIDGAGDEVVQYATTVMDHLTDGGHAATRNTLEFLHRRNIGSSEVTDSVNNLNNSSEKLLSDSDMEQAMRWLESRPARDRLFAERLEALYKPMRLQDISNIRADNDDGESFTEGQKQKLFAQNNRSLQQLHEGIAGKPPSSQANNNNNKDEVDEEEGKKELERNLRTLAEQMCVSLVGSRNSTTWVPGLVRPPPPPPPPPAVRQQQSYKPHPPITPYSARTPRHQNAPTYQHSRVSSSTSMAIPARSSRTVSTPSLPTLNSASLASAVRSDLMDDLLSE